MQFSRSILIGAVACLTPLMGQAASITHANLKMSMDGMDFSKFTCKMTSHGNTVSPSSCKEIDVATITDPAEGIEFSSGFHAEKDNNKHGLNFDDVVLGYHLLSKLGITSIGLDFNGFIEGHAMTSVAESIFSKGKLIAFAFVTDKNQSTDIPLWGTYNDLFVRKDIYVGAYKGGEATICFIDQTFTEAASTPEPSTTALLGGGLIGAACLLRRRTKKVEATV